MAEIKDYKELWTNRAQAHLRLAKYKEALSDCDWAQRVDENYVKAYVLEGKAYMGLKEYDTAIASFKKAIECDKTKAELVSGKQLSGLRFDSKYGFNRIPGGLEDNYPEAFLTINPQLWCSYRLTL